MLPFLRVSILNVPFVGELAPLKINVSPYMVLLTRQQKSFNPIMLNHIFLMKNIKNISV